MLIFASNVLICPWNPRLVWVGRDLQAHLVATPCHGQGHFSPPQVAQGPLSLLSPLFFSF